MARYDEVAAEYEARIVPRFAPAAKALADVAEVRPTDVVLEVGAGTGGLARMLPDAALVVVSDIAEHMLRVARTAAVGATIAALDQTALGVRDGCVDVVASQFTMLLDSADALAEARRVLGRGGRLAVAGWRDDYTEFDMLSAARQEIGLGPIPPYDEAADAERLRAAGFGELRFDALRLSHSWVDADDYLAYRAAFGVMPVDEDVWRRYCDAIEARVRAMDDVTFTHSIVLATAVAV